MPERLVIRPDEGKASPRHADVYGCRCRV